MMKFRIYIHHIIKLIAVMNPYFFDKEQEKKDKYKMLDLLGKLMKRLYEVNDGSFEIDDRETERVKNL